MKQCREHYVHSPVTTMAASVCISDRFIAFTSYFRCLLHKLSSHFFFSACSKLKQRAGFSALSESSVSDDTASSCAGLNEEGMRWRGGSGEGGGAEYAFTDGQVGVT